MPDLPTLARIRLAGFRRDLELRLLAPAGTPQRCRRLNKVLHDALADEDGAKAHHPRGRRAGAGTPEQQAAVIDREETKWAAVIRAAGICAAMSGRMRTIAAVARMMALWRDRGYGPAVAADYPTRPITLIVPYPAGGGNDVIARLVAAKMSASLGQPIVIENRGGAGSTIGTRDAARRIPDGYTLLIATSSLAINPSLYPDAGL